MIPISIPIPVPDRTQTSIQFRTVYTLLPFPSLPFTIHHSPFTVHRSPFAIPSPHHPSLTVHTNPNPDHISSTAALTRPRASNHPTFHRALRREGKKTPPKYKITKSTPRTPSRRR